MDCDLRWEKEHMMLRLADIVDLNNGERALMAVWNRYNIQRDERFQLARFFSQIILQLSVKPFGKSFEAHG